MIRDFERLKLGDDTVLLWSSGALMERHFCDPAVFARHGLSKRRVLELGSGSGLLAMHLARLGAEVTASDIEPDLSLLVRQVRGAGMEQRVRVVELLWGAEGWRQSVLSREDEPPFDFVFAADLIAIEEAHEDLLWTLRRVVEPQCTCFFGFKNREDFSLNFLAMLHDTGEFEVTEEADVNRDNVEDGEDVLIYRITRRRA
jgi:predicted nicotinamide N-methyase